MIYIIDIAKKIQSQLVNISNRIYDEFYKYKHVFGIGVTDADITTNTLEFTLELLITRLKEESEDTGLYLVSTVSFNFLVNEDRIIKITSMLYPLGGDIIREKEFIVHPYAPIEESNTIVQSSIDYIEELAIFLKEVLISKYLNV